VKYYNLFLDDERDPKDVLVYRPEPIYGQVEWIIVRNYEQFVNKVAMQYAAGFLISIVSLDHDVSREHYIQGVKSGFTKFDETAVTIPTGWHCLKWLLKFYEMNDLALPKIMFHSKNTGGVENMAALLDEFKNKKYRDA
jgi:hypothetical protein